MNFKPFILRIAAGDSGSSSSTMADKERRISRRLLAAAVLSIAAFAAVRFLAPGETVPHSAQMIHAAQLMAEATGIIRDYRELNGPEIRLAVDPNRTGLVGEELDDLTTTLGHLEAKRTTTNPNMAALLVHLLHRAGVRPHDSVAIGASASFPALLVASLSAARAMQVRPVVIGSLGASSYGTTSSAFNLLHIYDLLLDGNIATEPPAGVSLGGEKDTGEEYDARIRTRLEEQIRAAGLPLIREPDLRSNVAARMKLYLDGARGGKIAAFINIGGSYANLGTSTMALLLKPGLNTEVAMPPEPERGVLFEMAARTIPVVHLLYIKELAARNGLPWDPVPLPPPAKIEVALSFSFWAIVAAYFTLLALLLWNIGDRRSCGIEAG